MYYSNIEGDNVKKITLQRSLEYLDDVKPHMDYYITVTDISSSSMTATTLAMSILLYLLIAFLKLTIHGAELDWEKMSNYAAADETFFKTPNFKGLVLFIIVSQIQPYSMFNDVTSNIANAAGENYKFRINNFLLIIFLMINFYVITCSFVTMSYYLSPRSQRIFTLFGSKFNMSFGVKCIIKSQPFYSVIYLFVLLIIFGGFFIRIFER